ncbi:helix-loop-helix DNA-binding protein [Parachaetomium inaequale]|uniref:Helix-loop-helix DNA-binding protein n=1 Tax=Parachaetomium inaequale TaxID=2588326 RepID=A0AAN6PI62_9PEZI|nr:helix-loop-helix DNA-binding protein [Parachaetomium inaequale]
MANSPELSPSSSLSPQSAANRAEAEREGKRLTEEQKKVNHLTSEKKRRDNIRSGFDGLAGIVPGMEGRARSEGVVLFGAIDYVRRLMLERRAMIETLEGNGVTVDAELKL